MIKLNQKQIEVHTRVGEFIAVPRRIFVIGDLQALDYWSKKATFLFKDFSYFYFKINEDFEKEGF